MVVLLICIPLLRCFIKYRMSLFTLAWMFLALSHLVIHKMSVRFIFVNVVLPLPAVYPPLPSPLFLSSLNKSHGTFKGQSAVSDIPSERSKIGCRIFPDFQVGDYNSLQSFSTAPPPLPLLFGSSVCPVPLSRYFFLVKSSALCPGSTPGCPRGEGSWRAELQIPGQAGLLAGLACHSLFKQLCSKAWAGLTSEGNFLFGEVAAKEFPVWADRASWLEGFLEGKPFHNEMIN